MESSQDVCDPKSSSDWFFQQLYELVVDDMHHNMVLAFRINMAHHAVINSWVCCHIRVESFLGRILT
jgi:hypothetical protein